ncbi:FAA hydrolase family protein [Oleomonas cavernae]|uniref:FAA hydrolase family protein n=1 Tax=Oleomonas cavernae TaxID=2320859 RepID=A0A418WSV9_9PROT|nr:fumarylacetoacetate hydrolase family protein [Oleomonas cavernae]RJF94334.1 FAA hydrolase family protein [Oleomonas cavernae]
MKLVSFVQGQRQGYGAVKDGGIVDLSARLGPDGATIKDCLAHALGLAAAEVARTSADLALDEVTLLPPVPVPDKILCIGVNYADHAAEMGRAPPPYPTVFTRFADTLVGHGGALVRPGNSKDFDYEGELAVVIGRTARHVRAADAMAHVAGYACFQDASVRDFQRHTSQFIPGKNFPGTGGFGPWLVTADEVADPHALTLVTRVGGVERQRGRTADMIFKIPALIAYLSSFTTLRPGDVIATGTPAGVAAGRTLPPWLIPGDSVEVEIEQIGLLRNHVSQEG